MHKINITNGAARWLANILNANGIFATTADVFYAGVLLGSHLEPDLNLAKEKQEGEAWEEHAKLPHAEFEISEAQRETIKRGIEEVVKKGAVGANRYIVELITKFGLQPA